MTMNTTIYWKETKYEFLKLFRTRRYAISVLGMPLMFYSFFALGMPASQSFHLPTYLLATYGTFGVMSACLFGVGANIAHERSLGWLEMKRVSPLSSAAYLFGKIAANLVFCVAVELSLLAAGLLFGHVRLAVWEAVRITGVLVLGAIPFAALGVALGYLIQASSAPATLNMINLPMAFCSGLWIPMMFLPPFLQKVAVFLPSYHLSKLALDVIGLDSSPALAQHWEALAAFTLIFIGLAFWAFERQGEAAEAH
jgi:ABC-2 type transport system permease protein